MNEDEPEEINPEDLPEQAKKALEEFEAIMKDIHDPVASGYAVIAEMYNGFRAAGMERIDAYCLVASYLVMHDHLGKEDD